MTIGPYTKEKDAVDRSAQKDITAGLAMSIEAFCRAAHCGRSTVYGEIAAGRLQAKKLGGRTLILREEAVRYLRALPDLAPQQKI